jgi:hypothetical protein
VGGNLGRDGDFGGGGRESVTQAGPTGRSDSVCEQGVLGDRFHCSIAGVGRSAAPGQIQE